MKRLNAIFAAFRNQNWKANAKNARGEELVRARAKVEQIKQAHDEQLKIDPTALVDSNGQYVKFSTAVIEQAPIENGLISLFQLDDENIFDGEKVQYDVLKYNRKVPKGKKKNGAFTVNETAGYETFDFAPPKYKEAYPSCLKTCYGSSIC